MSPRPPGRPHYFADHPWRTLVVAGLVLTVLGEVLAWWAVQNFPVLAAEQGRVVDEAIAFILYLSVPVFVLITLVLVFSTTLFRSRSRGGGRREGLGRDGDAALQVRTDRRTVLTWLAVSTGLAALTTVYPGISGLQKLAATQKDTPDTLLVDVVAKQWGWFFSYPDQQLRFADELVLPVGRRVRFRLKTLDVIHSFWVPAFRIKLDMIPGRERSLWLTPDRIISTSDDPRVRVQCAELCGVGHAEMASTVRIVSEEDFLAWAAEQRGKPPTMDQMQIENQIQMQTEEGA